MGGVPHPSPRCPRISWVYGRHSQPYHCTASITHTDRQTQAILLFFFQICCDAKAWGRGAPAPSLTAQPSPAMRAIVEPYHQSVCPPPNPDVFRQKIYLVIIIIITIRALLSDPPRWGMWSQLFQPSTPPRVGGGGVPEWGPASPGRIIFFIP